MKRYSGAGVIALLVLTIGALLMIWNPRSNTLKLRLGLDLKSGSHIAVQLIEAKNPLTDEIVKVDARVLEQAVQVFQRRLNPDGTREIVVTPEPPDRLIVEIPEETNLEKAEGLVRQAARLEFKEQIFNPVTKETTWKTVMDGSSIAHATAQPSMDGGAWEVHFELTRQGAKDFADLTRRLVKRPLGIFFDGREISSPIVNLSLIHISEPTRPY